MLAIRSYGLCARGDRRTSLLWHSSRAICRRFLGEIYRGDRGFAAADDDDWGERGEGAGIIAGALCVAIQCAVKLLDQTAHMYGSNPIAHYLNKVRPC